MDYRRKPREWLLSVAQKLGLDVPPGISTNELVARIERAPATKSQMNHLRSVLELLGRKSPRNMTFGRASDAIDAAEEILNSHVIDSMGLTEGLVILWHGKYFRVNRMCGKELSYKLLLEPVVLARKPREAQTRVIPTGARLERVSPRTLYQTSEVVNLATWRP